MQVRNNPMAFSHAVETPESKKVAVKSDFVSTFGDAYKQTKKNDMDNYINRIKSIGNQIISTQNYSDVVNYKKVIKEYLKEIVEYAYSLNKNTSFWEAQYFTTVETVNSKLEELTKNVLLEQKTNIDIASSIEGIQGLIIDIYI